VHVLFTLRLLLRRHDRKLLPRVSPVFKVNRRVLVPADCRSAVSQSFSVVLKWDLQLALPASVLQWDLVAVAQCIQHASLRPVPVLQWVRAPAWEDARALALLY